MQVWLDPSFSTGMRAKAHDLTDLFFTVGAVQSSQVGTKKYVDLAEQRQKKKKSSKTCGLCGLGEAVK